MPRPKPPTAESEYLLIQPKRALSSWTFTLWLTFQRRREDDVGALARFAAADPTWWGWRSLDGLDAYLRGRKEPEERLAALHQAWDEWKAGRKEA